MVHPRRRRDAMAAECGPVILDHGFLACMRLSLVDFHIALLAPVVVRPVNKSVAAATIGCVWAWWAGSPLLLGCNSNERLADLPVVLLGRVAAAALRIVLSMLLGTPVAAAAFRPEGMHPVV